MNPTLYRNSLRGWKHFLEIVETLLQQPSTSHQAKFITETIEDQLACSASFWFSEPHYPLPGEPGVSIFQKQSPPELAQSAFQLQKTLLNCSTPKKNKNAIDKIALPLISNKKLLGVIFAETNQRKSFNVAEIQFLKQFAAHSALALESYRQLALNKRRFEQLNLVRKVSNQIATLVDLDELCRQVTKLIQETFHYYFVTIYTYDEDLGALQFRASASSRYRDRMHVVSAVTGRGIIGHVARDGKELLAPDVSKEEKYYPENTLPETSSEVAFPLVIENRVLGVLDVQSDKLDAFHEIDLLVLRALADNIALGVEGTKLYSDLKWQSNRLKSVIDISRAINSILDLDKLLIEVIDNIRKVLDYPDVSIYSVHLGRDKIHLEASRTNKDTIIRNPILDLYQENGVVPWVGRTSEVFHSEDLQSDPRTMIDPNLDNNSGSKMTIPLLFGKETLGVLDVYKENIHGFRDRDLQFLEGLSVSIAIAMRNATLYHSETWRRKVSESFRDIAGLVSANIAVDQLLVSILEEIKKNLPCDVSAVWLLEDAADADDPDSRKLYLAASDGIDPEVLYQVYEHDPDVRGKLERALNSIDVVIRKPGDPYGPLGKASQYPPDYSSIAAPLIAGDEPLGLLTLAIAEPKRYGLETKMMTKTFADYAAIAIQNTHLYEESQIQGWISSVLLRIAEVSQSINNIDELFHAMAQVTPMLVGIKKCVFFLWDERKQVFFIKSLYGFDQKEINSVIPLGKAPGLADLINHPSRMEIFNAKIEIGKAFEEVENDRIKQFLFPLKRGNAFQGALYVTYKSIPQAGKGRASDRQTLEILQGLADQTSITLENLQLQEDRQEEAYVTAVLLEVARTIVQQKYLDAILLSVLRLLSVYLGIHSSVIYLWDAVNKVFTPEQALGSSDNTQADLLKFPYASGEHAFLDMIYAKNDSYSCELIPADLEQPRKWAQYPGENVKGLDKKGGNLDFPVLLGIPLSFKNEFYGVLLVTDPHFSSTAVEKRMEILRGTAQQITMAIQNERYHREIVQRERFEQELQLAQQIQRNFLPQRLPLITGWEMGSHWIPARQVGGDFYDVFQISRNKYALVIADVSDKSIPAALYMTVTRSLIRAYYSEHLSPAEVLGKVNHSLLFDTQDTMFVSIILAVLDIDDNEITYCIAGHLPPIIYRAAEKRVWRLEKGGIALGIQENINLENRKIQLSSGDIFLLYTDGITEGFSPEGEQFGEHRLMDFIRKHPTSVKETITLLNAEILKYQQNSPPTDDITLLGLQKK